MLTPDQIDRVRASWSLIVPVAETVAARFYQRLFEVAPSLRSLFEHTEPASQRRKLVQSLAMVVASVDDFDRLLEAVEALGRRHVEYGVKASDYELVGDALVWTLAYALGDAFDSDTRAAWVAAYDLIAQTMQQATLSSGF